MTIEMERYITDICRIIYEYVLKNYKIYFILRTECTTSVQGEK